MRSDVEKMKKYIFFGLFNLILISAALEEVDYNYDSCEDELVNCKYLLKKVHFLIYHGELA